jgi:hypothetical protein
MNSARRVRPVKDCIAALNQSENEKVQDHRQACVNVSAPIIEA